MKQERKFQFKKKFMVISKKKIAAIICTGLLAAAAVVNYVGTNSYTEVNLDIPKGVEEYDEDTIYGEAKYVDSKEESLKEAVENETKEVVEFEEDGEMSIEKSRSEAVSLLQTVAQSETAAADKKAEAQGEIIKIADDMQREAIVREILEKKGFADVSVYLTSPSATVSVKSDGLTETELLKIRDILKDEGNIMPQNLKIIETK